MILIGVVLFAFFPLLRFPFPGRHHGDRRRLGVRLPVNWQQRTPHPPNDWIQTVHQMQFAPSAICFQLVPSENATHRTPPVPPALRLIMAPLFFAGVMPTAVKEATLVKPFWFRFSASPLRMRSK